MLLFSVWRISARRITVDLTKWSLRTHMPWTWRHGSSGFSAPTWEDGPWSYNMDPEARATSRPCPQPSPCLGYFGVEHFLGGILFIVKFNGACIRPPVSRPFSGNKALQVKYIDDSTQAASINLKKSLIVDPETRLKPLRYQERNQTILNPEEDILQMEIDRFYAWTFTNKLPINRKKCLTMKCSRSCKYDFPMKYTIGSPKILKKKDNTSNTWRPGPVQLKMGCAS